MKPPEKTREIYVTGIGGEPDHDMFIEAGGFEEAIALYCEARGLRPPQPRDSLAGLAPYLNERDLKEFCMISSLKGRVGPIYVYATLTPVYGRAR